MGSDGFDIFDVFSYVLFVVLFAPRRDPNPEAWRAKSRLCLGIYAQCVDLFALNTLAVWITFAQSSSIIQVAFMELRNLNVPTVNPLETSRMALLKKLKIEADLLQFVSSSPERG